MFDRDGSGKVSSSELRQVLTTSGRMKLTDEEVNEMIEAVDEVISLTLVTFLHIFIQDNDGMIDFNELIKMFTGADSIRELVTGEAEESAEEQIEDEGEEEPNSSD